MVCDAMRGFGGLRSLRMVVWTSEERRGDLGGME